MKQRDTGEPTTLLRETLAQTLAERAAEVVMPPMLATMARARARRIVVRRRIAATAASIACLLAVVGTGVAVSRSQHSGHHSVAASLLPHWPARGTDVGDSAGIDAVLRAWEAKTGEQLTLAQVLYAGRDSIGSAALLLATDTSGHLRLGGLVGAAGSAWSPETLVVDKPVSAPLVAASLVHEAAGRNPVLVLVTDPGFDQMSWQDADSASDASMPAQWDSDSLLNGVDILTFGDPNSGLTEVTLSGPGRLDREVTIDH